MKKRKGFTLFETLIVVVIIAVALGFFVPRLEHSRAQSRLEHCTFMLHQIDSAKIAFQKSHHLSDGDLVHDAADLVPDYLQKWPDEPGNVGYSANPIGSKPTFKNLDEDELRARCETDNATCPFY